MSEPLTRERLISRMRGMGNKPIELRIGGSVVRVAGVQFDPERDAIQLVLPPDTDQFLCNALNALFQQGFRDAKLLRYDEPQETP